MLNETNETNETEVKPSKKERLIIADQNIAILKKRIEELESSLKQQTSYADMYRKDSSEKQSEIDEIHDFLDGLQDVLPKEKSNYGKNKLSTRLLSWVAKKA